MNININIQQIENGFLVALPPEAATSTVQLRNVPQQQAAQSMQPRVKYAEDFNGVVALMKANWPVQIEE